MDKNNEKVFLVKKSSSSFKKIFHEELNHENQKDIKAKEEIINEKPTKSKKKRKIKDPNAVSYWTIIKRLLKNVKEFKFYSIITPIFVVCEVIVECLIPYFIGNLVDELNMISGNDGSLYMQTIWYYVSILVPLAIASLTFGVTGGIFGSKAAVGFAKNTRQDMFSRIQDFSFENIDKYASSGLVTRMTTDVYYLQMSYLNIVRTAFRAPILIVFSLIMSFVRAPSVAWIFLIILPVLLMGLLTIVLKAFPHFSKVFKEYDHLNESVEENIKGIRVVKTFVRSNYEKKKFAKAAGSVEKHFVDAEKIASFMNPLMQLCIFSVITLLTYFGGKSIITDISGTGMTVGDYNALLVYGIQSLFALMLLCSVIMTVVMSAESSKRVYQILTEVPTIKSPENPVMEVKDGSVEFKDVCFKYSASAEKFALSNVNLSIKSGETIGIIGGTGSSKSTLVNLLSRLYDVSEGSVKVGGVDVRDYDLKVLRDNVSVVLQKNVLFSGTIKDNLKWGNKDASDEEIIHASKLACADDFVMNFKDGYDHKIEQGGTNVSGGQKQRLCIARALLKKPKILVLDDSTSAVDTKTDAKIRQSFKEEIPNITKFIIAQRISSVQDSDRIIVMNDGQINGFGTHDELLKNNKIYQECYYSQVKGGGEE